MDSDSNKLFFFSSFQSFLSFYLFGRVNSESIRENLSNDFRFGICLKVRTKWKEENKKGSETLYLRPFLYLPYLTNFIKLNRRVYLPSVRILKSGKAKYKPCSPLGFFSRLGELTRDPINTRVHLGGFEMMFRSSVLSADHKVTWRTKKGICKVLRGSGTEVKRMIRVFFFFFTFFQGTDG